MSDERRSWTGWGSIAMAVLAAVALAVTVFVAQRGLSHASNVVVRGEADALVSSVIAELAQDEVMPPTTEALERELASHTMKGLRYIALVDREGRPIAEAGRSTMPHTPMRPGDATIIERRVRTLAILPPPRRVFGMPPPHFGPALLVVELEPPVIEQLRGHLTRISVVAAGAAIVLVAFAIAWSRSATRLAAIERRAAREQRLVALGSMSSVMAHELRNPLASLKGHAQLLAEDLDDEKQRKKAERVVAEAVRLEVLTTSLLDFVRDGPMETSRVSAKTVVTRALEDLASDRVDVRGDGTLDADESRLARAVHNVIDNALKASADRVEIVIEQNDGVTIAVRDRGEGLPEGAQIFEPFITTRTRGTGLGLPVARRIAEQHGGTLVGENAEGGGAVFTFRLPRST